MSATEQEDTAIDTEAFVADDQPKEGAVPDDAEQKLKEAEEALEETLEVFELSELSAPREWTFSYAGKTESFVQRPLGMVPKVEYFAYIANIVDVAMNSPDSSLTFERVLDMMSPTSEESMMADAQQMMLGLLRLAAYAPEILARSYCIWLGVPPAKREWFVNAISQPTTEGGLSDDDGFVIIETFLDQNAEAITGFFGERIRALQKRAKERFGTRERDGSGGASRKQFT